METPELAGMDIEELRQLAASLISAIGQKDVEREQILKESQWKDLKISQLTHEMAILKRWSFGRAAEEFHGLQRSLLEESIDEDLGAIELELDDIRETPRAKKAPVRAHLPVELPRVKITHEPDSTVCQCGCSSTTQAIGSEAMAPGDRRRLGIVFLSGEETAGAKVHMRGLDGLKRQAHGRTVASCGSWSTRRATISRRTEE